MLNTFDGMPIRKALWKYADYGHLAQYQMPTLHNHIQRCYKLKDVDEGARDFIKLHKHVDDSYKAYESSISPITQYYSQTDADGFLIHV